MVELETDLTGGGMSRLIFPGCQFNRHRRENTRACRVVLAVKVNRHGGVNGLVCNGAAVDWFHAVDIANLVPTGKPRFQADMQGIRRPLAVSPNFWHLRSMQGDTFCLVRRTRMLKIIHR